MIKLANENFLLSYKELVNLIADREKLLALECGGVGSWEWCYESQSEYLKGLNASEEIVKNLDFKSLAENYVNNYL